MFAVLGLAVADVPGLEEVFDRITAVASITLVIAIREVPAIMLKELFEEKGRVKGLGGRPRG